jgi:DNA-binding CsgD family transcriptional regulator
MLAGDGRLVVSDQLILFAANAGGGLALVALARHFLAGVPQHIARARAGAEAIARQPSIVRSPTRRLLVRGDPAALVTALSNAERRVLALLAAGRAPKQAARELDVALATVRTHIASAKRKTGARTLEQLVGLFAEGSHVR